jgi:hypothetical protein
VLETTGRRISKPNVDNARPTVMGRFVVERPMTEQLQQARDDLEAAAKSADSDDVREDIRETTDAFADDVMSDTAPDHAVLDERLNTLRQARERADGTTAAKLESAIETTEDYRETLEQA